MSAHSVGYRDELKTPGSYLLGAHFGHPTCQKYGGFRSFKTVLLVILGLLKFVQNSSIKPIKTCYYCPIIISTVNYWAVGGCLCIQGGAVVGGRTESTASSGSPSIEVSQRDPIGNGPYTPQRDSIGEFWTNFRKPKMISFGRFWSLTSFFELRNPENRIREVQLVYRKVVPRRFDPPETRKPR